MRTTLSIDQDVLDAAKDIAARENKTAGEVVSELARRALVSMHVGDAGGTSGSGQQDFYGFVTLPPGPEIVTNAMIDRIREEEGI